MKVHLCYIFIGEGYGRGRRSKKGWFSWGGYKKAPGQARGSFRFPRFGAGGTKAKGLLFIQ